MTRDPAARYEIIDGLRFRVTAGGLIYDPAPACRPAKYPCPDCRVCLFCPESKCGPCLGRSDDPRPSCSPGAVSKK
jgi:hypothetical protein